MLGIRCGGKANHHHGRESSADPLARTVLRDLLAITVGFLLAVAAVMLALHVFR